MLISSRLVLPTSVEGLDTVLSNSFSINAESLSLASCGTCASCSIIDSFLTCGLSAGSLIPVVCLGVLLSYFLCCPVTVLLWSMIYCFQLQLDAMY